MSNRYARPCRHITYTLRRTLPIVSAKPSLRQEQRILTRRRIAEAARDCFYQHGVAETSVEQIARAAGVGRATLYLHFANKDAILLELLGSNLRGVRLLFQDLCDLEAIEPDAARAWLMRYIETLRDHRDAMQLFQVGLANHSDARSLVDDYRDTVAVMLERRFPTMALGAGQGRARLLLLLARIDHFAGGAADGEARFDIPAALDLVAAEIVAVLTAQPL